MSSLKAIVAIVCIYATLPFVSIWFLLRILFSKHFLLKPFVRNDPLKYYDGKRKTAADQQKDFTVLVTGGKMSKSLAVARHLHATGRCRVIVVDSTEYWCCSTQFSKAVSKFYTLPNPRFDEAGFRKSLAKICKDEKVDAIIPVSAAAASVFECSAADHMKIPVLNYTADVVQMLDDKQDFSENAKSAGLLVPESWKVTTKDRVRELNTELLARNDKKKFIIKSIVYDAEHRRDLFLLPTSESSLDKYLSTITVAKDHPWIVQQFISGDEYSSYSVVENGNILLHVFSESSISNLNWEHLEENWGVYEWVEKYAKFLGGTGQLCIDWIIEDGVAYPIECNPRCSSCVTAFQTSPRVGDALLRMALGARGDHSTDLAAPLFSLQGFVEQACMKPLPKDNSYWVVDMFTRLIFSKTPGNFFDTLSKLSQGRDAVFQPNDPLPFFMLNYFHIPALLFSQMLSGKEWIKVDFCIGKIVQPGGD